ncbi:uncharacterized protein F5Z01DRAFT_650578 [Emericellopsis atlantica]|uniref:Uncharacterized protein n=1 Tax=Emericellopsis atlantica TaxID=2614577 RepID=A0A9P7ZPL3_9HYPO|nr:uncharacterized protein F5Z01DRAFT_650578 [Emericellopsis atlantica]KAG9255938.1 hypothetical protein F5Z01DRAFT_650578 [Emericellopsis atlantica]
MADDDGESQFRRTPQYRAQATPATPDRAMRSSEETGESSQSGSLRRVATPSTATTDRSHNASGSDVMGQASSPVGQQPGGGSLRSRRRIKGRSTGGFLLQDTVAPVEESSKRRRATSLLRPKGKSIQRTPERPRQSTGQHQEPYTRHSTTSPPTRHDASRASRTPERQTKDTTEPSSGSPNGAVPDTEATQIVNMALSLGESRGAASRRYGPRSNPPRLAPLPDSASKSNLRQHFQQQRRTSQAGSPRPSPGASPRLPSGHRANSPMHVSQDSGHDGTYQYQFSAATLARAQKAKEHLELLAEYRRLLTSLPPLRPEYNQQSGSAPGSPNLAPRGSSSTSKGGQLTTTRSYNPLQYVRNRKVRARERKVIDGELLGFGDIESVREWVDRVTESGYIGGRGTGVTFTMPHFSSNQELDQQASTDPVQAMRVKRPRVDWFFDPCDMIADAYWLEQDHHKHLIEDRFWRKIFPAPAQDTLQSTSGKVDDTDQRMVPMSLTDADHGDKAHDLRLIHTNESVEGRRDRAKQKVYDMRPFHHRHNSSGYGGHNLLRPKRGSVSDQSGSDSENRPELKRSRTRGGRRDTITSDTSDLLQKQMNRVMAQEEQAAELAHVTETEAEHKLDEQGWSSPAKTPSASGQIHSRKTSVADYSDPDTRLNGFRAQIESSLGHKPGRPSLEAPQHPRRSSLTKYHSNPASPQLEDEKDLTSPPKMNNIVSVASSRSGSPTRNPISKIKRKLKDRSRDNEDESHSEAEDDARRQGSFMPEPPSPSERLATRRTDESYRAHRPSNSMRLRGEDQGNGLRGLFKSGPRIDTVFRGGVAKIGDILWKKDGNENEVDGETSEESDNDNGIGPNKQPPALSRRQSRRAQEDAQGPNAKHFLDSMPEFHHVGEPPKKTSGAPESKSAAASLSGPVSRQSAKWEQLRPPRIDVRDTSPTAPPSVVSERGEHDGSPSGGDHGHEAGGFGGKDETLKNLIDAQMLDPRSRSASRHWSIHDHDPSPERARLSKREIARVRALILSSGIKAMEINRRAHEQQKPLSHEHLALTQEDPRSKIGGVTWASIATLTPDVTEFQDQSVATCDMYPLASRALGAAMQASGQRWQASADKFASETTPKLQERIRKVRSRLTDDLSQMTRNAADEADETSKQLALDQPLKVKHVVDTIEKLLRSRRRRFRYVRRGLWLAVEWALVGFMWYVWFMVMVVRVFLGVGRGAFSAVKWLLWL